MGGEINSDLAFDFAIKDVLSETVREPKSLISCDSADGSLFGCFIPYRVKYFVLRHSLQSRPVILNN